MRSHNGRTFYTVGEIAKAASVSNQTLRVWENKGLLGPTRSPGGQRLYSEDDRKAAIQVALLRRHRGWNPAAIHSWITMEPPAEAWGGLSPGMRIRVARRSRSLTLADAAKRVGISRSFMSAIERGEADASQQITNRIAAVLAMPLSAFAPIRTPHGWLIRAEDRPRTVLKGGVTWQELASPGHRLEPALLTVPSGGSSGGQFVLRHETFAHVLKGTLHCQLPLQDASIELRQGDSVILPPETRWGWENRTSKPVELIWVELLQLEEWSELSTALGPDPPDHTEAARTTSSRT